MKMKRIKEWINRKINSNQKFNRHTTKNPTSKGHEDVIFPLILIDYKDGEVYYRTATKFFQP